VDDNRYEEMSPEDINLIENGEPPEISRRWGYPGEDLLPWGSQRVWPWMGLPWTYDDIALGKLLEKGHIEMLVDESGDVRLEVVDP